MQPPVDAEAVLSLASEPQTVVAPGDVPNVVTVGRISPEKQISLCLRVHHWLKGTGVRFRWYVIGDGPEEPKARAEIRELGMEDDFILLGRRDNVFSILKACDAFALFSMSEGCPTAVLEALTLGLPAIMTDVNGAEEMIDHESTGLIVANDPAAIADGLTRIVQDAGLRQRFRENLANRDARPDAGRKDSALLDIVGTPGPTAPAPKVTILIPTYNQERFIDRAIASALWQDHPSLEVVVLDDASTDGAGRAARAWSHDPRFRYACNERNLGRVENYRRGRDRPRARRMGSDARRRRLPLGPQLHLAAPATRSTATATGRSSSLRRGTASTTSTAAGATPTFCPPSTGPSK